MKILHMHRFVGILILAFCVFPFMSGPVRAEEAVSYLYEPLLAQLIELQELDETGGVEMVPYEVDTAGDIVPTGEVLSSGTGSVCGGVRLTKGSSMCSEHEQQQNITDYITGNFFSKDCPVRLIWGSYPRFYIGWAGNGDTDNPPEKVDVRYMPFDIDDPSRLPQWPPFSDDAGLLTTDTEGPDAKTPGASYKQGVRNLSAPNDPAVDDLYEDDFTQASKIEVTPTANDMVQEGEFELSTDECREDASEPTSGTCPSGYLAYKQADVGEYFMPPDKDKIAGRPESEVSTCILVEKVPATEACLDLVSLLETPILLIQGQILNLECLLKGDCMTNVKIEIYAESLRGTNQGCEPPCIDFASDMLVSVTRAPDTTNTCSSYGNGMNSPCVEDNYVGTPGVCSICGKPMACTIIWPNYVKDNYERLSASLGACDPDENPWCDWDTYWDFVKEKSKELKPSAV